MSFTNTKSVVFGQLEVSMAADAVINPGEIVVVVAGFAKPGSTATGQTAIGASTDLPKDNTGGADGAMTIRVDTSYPKTGGRRLFWFANDTSSGALGQADVFTNPAYVKNATTVTKTSTGASKAGTVAAYDATNNMVGVLFDQ